MCYLKFVALFNIFQVENHYHIEMKRLGTGKERVDMGMEFFKAIGVLAVELSACQVPTVCTANWPR